MAETENIAKMAELVSENIFNFFKWHRCELVNSNFDCKRVNEHAKSKDAKKHTHPVDVVFYYDDPYTNNRIMLNTDLKSYAVGSITQSNVRNSLKSLAATIQCAKSSKQWKDRYKTSESPCEVRGLLFTYNHDGKYDKDFYNRFFIKFKDDPETKKVINTGNLGLKKDQIIHIFEPNLISYLTTLINDVKGLAADGKFPMPRYNQHWFFYPDRYLHKTHLSKYERAASAEMLGSSYLIIGHDAVKEEGEEIFPKGYIVYYNGEGYTIEEFKYLLDTLSNNQLLDSDMLLRIRCTSPSKNKDIFTIFRQAVSEYTADWGFDVHKKLRLDDITSNFHSISETKTSFSEIDVGWRN